LYGVRAGLLELLSAVASRAFAPHLVFMLQVNEHCRHLATNQSERKTRRSGKGGKGKGGGTFLAPSYCPGDCLEGVLDGTAPLIVPCDGDEPAQQWDIDEVKGSSPPLFQIRNSVSGLCMSIDDCVTGPHTTIMVPCEMLSGDPEPFTLLTLVGGSLLLNWGCWLQGEDLFLDPAGDRICDIADTWDDDGYYDGLLLFLKEIQFRL
jgi:hypothetical protein